MIMPAALKPENVRRLVHEVEEIRGSVFRCTDEINDRVDAALRDADRMLATDQPADLYQQVEACRALLGCVRAGLDQAA